MSGDGRMQGKVGLVVGVANHRSLAWAIAQAVAAEGARVVLTYQGRFEEHVKELAQKLSPDTLVLPCDVQQDGEIAAVFAAIQQTYGGLDFLVHGAAFAQREDLVGGFVNTSRDGFRTAMDISAYSLIALARGAQPLMQSRGGGSIVTLSFLGSDRVFPNYNVMGVAKAALESSVRYLASDLGPHNIRVNSICPGAIKTPINRQAWETPQALEALYELIPYKRIGEVEDIGKAAVFLASDASDYIIGANIYVDGGMCLYPGFEEGG
jgi:enoyl-[acyl-carrier protein] reductase I